MNKAPPFSETGFPITDKMIKAGVQESEKLLNSEIDIISALDDIFTLRGESAALKAVLKIVKSEQKRMEAVENIYTVMEEARKADK